ncbi:Zinc knuckle CX2CX4HX4C [Corchorus olitorius]|uniref:Zinc knuckle CX2CX4HX4C n=1 Tax=Corchorus olitorius TaxID=93759 RepID=A0A1R3KS57_9ROSI|nr:Zinc knuckle CX2CX4HX4C [Corchorus olitorius]
MVLPFEEPVVDEPDDIVGDLDVLELSTDDAVNIQAKKTFTCGKGGLGEDERDKSMVLKQGPWSVMDCHLVLKEWPEEATLKEIDLPLQKFGMKVLFNVEDPLKTDFNLKRKGAPTMWVKFKYECPPEFCYHCGRLSHSEKDCRFQHDGRKKDFYRHRLRAAPMPQKLQSSKSFKSQNKNLSGQKKQRKVVVTRHQGSLLETLTSKAQPVPGERDNCVVILDSISKFSKATGQMFNLAKSAALFSPNTEVGVKQHILKALGVQEMQQNNVYLGLPSFGGEKQGGRARLYFSKNSCKKCIHGKENSYHKLGGRFFSAQEVQAIKKIPIGPPGG